MSKAITKAKLQTHESAFKKFVSAEHYLLVRYASAVEPTGDV